MFKNVPDYLKKKLLDPAQIEDTLRPLKTTQKIVSLNGSFDLLHAGHLHILSEAKAQGDCLIVALNTDASIKRYKGESRPLIPLRYRLEMLSALFCVDYVTWFDEDDPRKILSLIKPDIHVNGSEYGQDCLEAKTVQEHKGKVHIVPLIAGLSTSKIIEKIKEVCV